MIPEQTSHQQTQPQQSTKKQRHKNKKSDREPDSLVEELVRIYMIQQMEIFAQKYQGFPQEKLSKKFHAQYDLNFS